MARLRSEVYPFSFLLCVVISVPTRITAGFTTQSVFIGLPIIPIRLTGDTLFVSYSITPAPSSGLSFNATSGVISGTYNGAVTTTVFQITGTNALGSTTAAFTLVFKRLQLEASIMTSSDGCEHRGPDSLLHPQDKRFQDVPRGVVLLHGIDCVLSAGDAGPGRQLL